MLWFSVVYFGVRVSATFHLIGVHIIISSVWIAEWISFGKELLIRLTMCSLFIWTICNFSYFPFWFGVWVWFLFASVPGLCVLFAFRLPLGA